MTISFIPISDINPASKPPSIDNETRTIINSRTTMAPAVIHSVFSKPVNHSLGAWVSTTDRIRLRSRKELLVFVKGPPGPRKTWPPGPIPRPAERLWAGRVSFGFTTPTPSPARSPDGSPLKKVWRNGAPSREWAGTRPGRGRGGDQPQNNPPGPL